MINPISKQLKPVPTNNLQSLKVSKSSSFGLQQSDQNDFPSQQFMKNSYREQASKFRKQKQSAQTVEVLAKTVNQQYAKIDQLRLMIRQQKNQMVKKKAENVAMITSLKTQIVGLEKQNDNYKHNSQLRIMKAQKSSQLQYQRLKLAKISNTKKAIFSPLNQQLQREKLFSKIKQQRLNLQKTLKQTSLKATKFISQLSSQYSKQTQSITQSISSLQAYSSKISNTLSYQLILKKLHTQYCHNQKIIKNIKTKLFDNRNNVSKLLTQNNEINYYFFPILQSLINDASLFSTMKSSYIQLQTTSSLF